MRAYLRDEEEQPGPGEENEEGEGGGKSSGGGRAGERGTGGTDSKQNGRQMYMPSWHMEELLSSLAVKLQASGQRETRYMPGAAMAIPASFTLFVLNPRPAWIFPPEQTVVEGRKVTYGYRCGLSSSALSTLAADQDVVHRAEKVERMEQKRWRIVHEAGILAGSDDLYDFQDVRYAFLRGWVLFSGTHGAVRVYRSVHLIVEGACAAKHDWSCPGCVLF